MLKEGISLQVRPPQAMIRYRAAVNAFQDVCTVASHYVEHYGLKEVVDNCHGAMTPLVVSRIQTEQQTT